MTRSLLLVFVHGFKGDDASFGAFPRDLQRRVAALLITAPVDNHIVHTAVYPRYETRGSLAAAARAFSVWLNRRIAEHGPRTSVVIVAHSMGGFVAADALRADANLQRCVAGLLTLDTPFCGLARCMLVVNALRNYGRVRMAIQTVAAFSAGPLAVGRFALGAARSNNRRRWRSTTVGTLAAGGMAAYTHRHAIRGGVGRLARNLTRRRNASQSLTASVSSTVAWLADHATFIGALLRPSDLAARRRQLEALRSRGLGLRMLYVSLGERWAWTRALPERTFCAVSSEADWFERWTVADARDEVQAHVGLFRRSSHAAYDELVVRVADLAAEWLQALPTRREVEDFLLDEEDGEAVKQAHDEIAPGSTVSTAILVEDDSSADTRTLSDSTTHISSWPGRLSRSALSSLPALPPLPSLSRLLGDSRQSPVRQTTPTAGPGAWVD